MRRDCKIVVKRKSFLVNYDCCEHLCLAMAVAVAFDRHSVCVAARGGGS